MTCHAPITLTRFSRREAQAIVDACTSEMVRLRRVDTTWMPWVREGLSELNEIMFAALAVLDDLDDRAHDQLQNLLETADYLPVWRALERGAL